VRVRERMHTHTHTPGQVTLGKPLYTSFTRAGRVTLGKLLELMATMGESPAALRDPKNVEVASRLHRVQLTPVSH
jgi:hypothetical protein